MTKIEQLYEEYIGGGTFGVDFEKKHILEFAEAYHCEKCSEMIEFFKDEKPAELPVCRHCGLSEFE